MADALTLKVSEEKYHEMLQTLRARISELKGYLGELQGKREQIANNYKGPRATKGIETIKKNEANVQTAIDRLEKQYQQIETYLKSMTDTDREIDTSYQTAMDKAQNIFK